MVNDSETGIHCLRIIVSGRVQGVGFRYYTKIEADRLGISGWVRNLPDGNVETLICGDEKQLDDMQAWLAHGPDHAHVSHCTKTFANESSTPDTFRITY